MAVRPFEPGNPRLARDLKRVGLLLFEFELVLAPSGELGGDLAPPNGGIAYGWLDSLYRTEAGASNDCGSW